MGKKIIYLFHNIRIHPMNVDVYKMTRSTRGRAHTHTHTHTSMYVSDVGLASPSARGDGDEPGR